MENLDKYKRIMYNHFSVEVVEKILNKWNEPHRYYHNINHLMSMLKQIDDYFLSDENEYLYMGEIYEDFIIAAFFHDVIYDPKANNNEENSNGYFVSLANRDTLGQNFQIVIGLIMCTKERKKPLDEHQSIFWSMDNNILINGTVGELIEYENNIFKEYQFAKYEIYKAKRLEFLNNMMTNFHEAGIKNNIASLIPYIQTRKIRVGIYSGTFNPFHLGHLDILIKSSDIFDKVIIAYGSNPDKNERVIEVPNALNYYQVDTFLGLITDYIKLVENKNVDVTIIRGLRNGADLDYESNQLSFIKDIKPDTKIVYIPCNKELEHISSSAIRNLMKFDIELASKYIVK